MPYSNAPGQMYAHLWSKYRPAVLKFMIDAEGGPQEYKLYGHEFKAINPKEKGGYSFVLSVYQGKAVGNDIKKSVIAQGLLAMLQRSNKANELLETAVYEFTLDKQFMLHIVRVEAPKIEEPEEESTKE